WGTIWPYAGRNHGHKMRHKWPPVGSLRWPSTIHLFVVWAAIYLTWGRRMRPTWRSYRFAVLVTLTWAIVTFIFNRIADTNYGFLNAKPSTASLLDLMGPWPVYLFSGMTIVFIIWALMTWPWERDGILDKDAAQPVV
ncbi:MULTISPECIES: TIGR02206 family membrane protein, partial [Actinomycetes]